MCGGYDFLTLSMSIAKTSTFRLPMMTLFFIYNSLSSSGCGVKEEEYKYHTRGYKMGENVEFTSKPH